MAIAVGERLLIAKQKATARYIGAVDGYEGTWVGVEWDEPSRGKHDGSVGGKKYFACTSAALTAGSFVRITKVNRGTSLVNALILRYTNKLAEGQAGDGQAYVLAAGSSTASFKLVGEEQVTERQSRIDLLKSARLVGANVSHIGHPGLLAATAPCLTQLDLTDNLIGNWAAVIDICQQLPHLQLLVLSRNKLQLPTTADEAVEQGLVQLSGLHCLVLNHCAVTWQQVGVIQSYLPNLQELHVAGNHISSLHLCLQQQEHGGVETGDAAAAARTPPAAAAAHAAGLSGFLNLQSLGLDDNCISAWWEVCRLAGLPALRRLSLSGNPLSSICYPRHSIPATALLEQQPPTVNSASASSNSTPQQQQRQAAFAVLEVLLVGGCQLSGWCDVDALDQFPALRECRLSGNPLFAVEGSAAAGAGRRFEVIGRVGGLTWLNGADVKPRERRDCELRYMQCIAAQAADTTAAGQQEVLVQHPRLAQLQAKYGQVSAVAARPAQAGTSISTTTAQIQLQYGSSSVKKKLPKTITMSALRVLCGRLFKLPPDQLQLLLSQCSSSGQQQQADGEDISADDTKVLGYWDVVDGSMIEVKHLDPQEMRQQQEQEQLASHQRHEHRMALQLQQGEFIRTAAER